MAEVLNLPRLDARLARSTVSARRDLDRARRQLRDLFRQRDSRRVVSFRRGTPRPPPTCVPLPEHTDMVWHGYLPGHPSRPVVWLPRTWAVRTGGRASIQSEQGCRRSIRESHRTPGPMGRLDVRISNRQPRRRPVVRHARQRAIAPLAGVIDPAFTWGDDRPPRTPWHRTVIYEMHVKGFTRLHPGIPERLRGTYEALTTEAGTRASDAPGCHGRRTDAGAPSRVRATPCRAGAVQLLGLQHAELLRPRSALLDLRQTGTRPCGNSS